MKKLLRMALFAALPLAAMMMFSSYSDGAGPQCPFDDSGFTVLLPNPENCSTFFSCSNGVPILMNCPDGLVFYQRLGTCSVPSGEGCEDNGFVYMVRHEGGCKWPYQRRAVSYSSGRVGNSPIEVSHHCCKPHTDVCAACEYWWF